MTGVQIPAASLARLRAQFAAFQQLAQTVVEAMGYDSVQGARVNLEQGVLELPAGTLNQSLGEPLARPTGVPDELLDGQVAH